MALYLLIILPILASLLLYLIPARVTTYLTAGVYVAVFAVTVDLFRRVRLTGQPITTHSGDGFLGITLYCDRTAALFLVLVSFLFLCVFLYTSLPVRLNKMYAFLITVLEGLVMLIFLSRDLFNLYVAVEVAAIVCAALIMFKRESRSIYDGLVYLLVNITGMLFFLLGLGLLYRQLGVLDLDSLQAALASRPARELLLPYALLMTGACMKCAVFPMHFWLPLAHGTPGAPTAVSALLSGVYVKSGVYLFIRLQEVFSPAFDLSRFFFWAGVVTALAGIVMAVCQSDIKLILAYHTVSQIGLILAGLCAGTEAARAGAMLHIVNHAVFKSLLFLAAGVLIAKYGTRDVYAIRGVMRSLPLVGVAIAAGILGITGAPFFNGSISKYFMAQAGSRTVDFCFLLINFGTTLSFVKFGRVLFGPRRELTYRYVNVQTAVLLVLSGLCLLTGVFAQPFMRLLFDMERSISPSGYAFKALIWVVFFVLADLFYRKVLRRSARLHAGIEMTIDFNGIVMCIGLSFALLLLAGLTVL